jgi:hypothetical protein
MFVHSTDVLSEIFGCRVDNGFNLKELLQPGGSSDDADCVVDVGIAALTSC